MNSVTEQPLSSVTIKLLIPAVKLVAEILVVPELHSKEYGAIPLGD